MSNAFASLLAEHVTDGWEALADIDRPGTAAKISAVRAGDADTRTLSVDVAVRLIGELDDPAAAAGGDTRVKVRDALGAATAARGATTAAAPTPAAERLFAGSRAEIVERLDARRGQLTGTHIAAWAALDVPTRDATAIAVLANTTSSGAAAVLIDLAVRHGKDTPAALAGIGPHIDSSGRSKEDRAKRRGAVRAGARSALAGWLRDHRGDADWSTVAMHRDNGTEVPHPVAVPHAAGEGLAAVAGILGMYFRGPTEAAAAAIARRRKPLEDNHVTHLDLLMCAIDSGVDWATIRRRLFPDGPLGPGRLVHTVTNVSATPQGRAIAPTILRTEIADMGPTTTCQYNVSGLLDRYGDQLSVTETLRLIAVTCGGGDEGDGDDDRTVYWAYVLLNYLSGADAPSAAQVAAAAAEDELVAGYLDRAARVLDRSAHMHGRVGGQLAVLWDRWVTVHPVERVWRGAEANDGAAAAWARHMEQLIADTGHDPGAVWAAAATLADGFRGTTAELIDVAAAAAA